RIIRVTYTISTVESAGIGSSRRPIIFQAFDQIGIRNEEAAERDQIRETLTDVLLGRFLRVQTSQNQGSGIRFSEAPQKYLAFLICNQRIAIADMYVCQTPSGELMRKRYPRLFLTFKSGHVANPTER